MENDIAKVFFEHKLRFTNPRKAVFDTLKVATAPLSHMEIAHMTPHADKVSIYRTIDLFMKLGIVVAVPHGWKQRYELAAPFRPHHHHLHCEVCGVVEEIQSAQLEKIIHALADRQGFLVTGHMFEITGMCSNCRTSKKR